MLNQNTEQLRKKLKPKLQITKYNKKLKTNNA